MAIPVGKCIIFLGFFNYQVASMAIPVGKCLIFLVSSVHILLGLRGLR